MTTDVKLLPLPNSGSGFYEDNVWHDTFSKRQMGSYARSNMEPLSAENERLRAEAAKRDGIDPWAVLLRAQEAEARAERLAEALRLALKWAEVLPTGEPLRAESVRDLDNARAALDQEGGKGGAGNG